MNAKPVTYMSFDYLAGWVKQVLGAKPEDAVERYQFYWEQMAGFIRPTLDG